MLRLFKITLLAAVLLPAFTALAGAEKLSGWNVRFLTDEKTQSRYCEISGPWSRKKSSSNFIIFWLSMDESGVEDWRFRLGPKAELTDTSKSFTIDGKSFSKEAGEFTTEEAAEIAKLLLDSSKFRYEISGIDPARNQKVERRGRYWTGLFNRHVRVCRSDLLRR